MCSGKQERRKRRETGLKKGPSGCTGQADFFVVQSNFLCSACYKKGVKEKLANQWRKNQVHCM